MKTSAMAYRGRLAPTPSGDLHIGHALTFLAAYERAKATKGSLILRIEDLYADHCRMDFVGSIIEDLKWLGINWDEGPDVGGPCGPYTQSERRDYYLEIWKKLYAAGAIYPSTHTRKDVERALAAPHEGDFDPVFPAELRPQSFEKTDSPEDVNWRFRANYGETVSFVDNRAGSRSFVAGKDFGDFVVWCKNGWPSYELAVVADDHAMDVTEVVRGEDLLLSTARQILLYRALGWGIPQYYHCPLVRDSNGVRLAKRSDSVSIRELRKRGMSPEEIFAMARGRKTL